MQINEFKAQPPFLFTVKEEEKEPAKAIVPYKKEKNSIQKIAKWSFFLIECIYAFHLSPKAISWLYKYQSDHLKYPIWIKPPSLKNQIQEIREEANLHFKKILNFYASENGIKEENVISFLSNLIKQNGACHGQCLELLALSRKHFQLLPKDLLKELKNSKKSIAFFQIVEIMRGFFEKKLISRKHFDNYQNGKISKKQIHSLIGKKQKRTFQNEMGLKNFFEKIRITHYFLEQVLAYFPKAEILHITLNGNQEERLEKEFSNLEKWLKKEKDIHVLVTAWNSKATSSHSFLFQCSEMGKYWLYNSNWMGLYNFSDKEHFIAALKDHLLAFYYRSGRVENHYLLEVYRPQMHANNR